MKRGEKLDQSPLPLWLQRVSLIAYISLVVAFICNFFFPRVGESFLFNVLLGLTFIGLLPQVVIKGRDVRQQINKFMLSYRVMFITMPSLLLLALSIAGIGYVFPVVWSVGIYPIAGGIGLSFIGMLWMGVDVIRRDVWPWWTFKYPRK